MKKNYFIKKIFLLTMLALIMSTNLFAVGAVKKASPAVGRSISSNYILDYGTSLNQHYSTTTIKEIIVNPVKDNCDSNFRNDCTSIATVTEIDLIGQPNTFLASTSISKISTNIIFRNLIYFLIGLILISIILILIIKFIRINNSLNKIHIKNKNKYD